MGLGLLQVCSTFTFHYCQTDNSIGMLFVVTEAPPCDTRPEQCREDSEGVRTSSLGGYRPPSSPECITSPPSSRVDVAPKMVIASSPDTMMEQSDTDDNRPYSLVDSPKSAARHTPTSPVTSRAVSPVEPWSPSSSSCSRCP